MRQITGLAAAAFLLGVSTSPAGQPNARAYWVCVSNEPVRRRHHH